METFRGFRKTTLKRIAEARGLESTGTTETLRNRLLQFKTPFSIDLSQTQEEIVLSLINIPTSRIKDYLISTGFEYEAEAPRDGSVNERIYLIESLLSEPLSNLSKEIISLGTSSLASLQRQAGRGGRREELIRIILKLEEQSQVFENQLRKELDEIGFKIITPPNKKIPKELDEMPVVFDASEVRAYLEDGFDSSYFPDHLLDEVIQEDLLFQRNVNVRAFARRMVTEPLSPLWPDIQPILKGRTQDDLQTLAQSYGYDIELTPSELEFLFQRQYLRKYTPETFRVPPILQNLLMQQLGLESFEEVEENLTPEGKDRLRLFSEWIDYSDEQLQHVAQGYGIELPYTKTREYFNNDLLSYLDVIDEDLEFGVEDLDLYSDAELLRWCPTLPYGRNAMIEAFNKFWEEPRIVFINDVFYQTNSWSEYEEIEDLTFEELNIQELRVLLPYLKDSVYQEEALEVYASKLADEPYEGEYDLNETDDLFELMANVAAARYGAADVSKWSNIRRAPNEELYEEQMSLLNDKIEEISDDVLNELKLYSLERMMQGKSSLNQMLQKEPSWFWIETAFYYYAQMTGKPLGNNIPLLFRKNKN